MYVYMYKCYKSGVVIGFQFIVCILSVIEHVVDDRCDNRTGWSVCKLTTLTNPGPSPKG